MWSPARLTDFDADKLAGFVAKGGERTLPAIAAHHHAIVAGGQPHHLQLVRPLIAPEPRQAVIDLGIASQPGRDAARMIGGILHGLQSQRSTEPLAHIERTIADRRDIGIGRQQMFVDDDFGCDRQAGICRQFDIGQDADADHHQISGNVPAVAQTDTGHLAAIAFDARDLHAQMNAHARRLCAAIERIPRFPRSPRAPSRACQVRSRRLQGLFRARSRQTPIQ